MFSIDSTEHELNQGSPRETRYQRVAREQRERQEARETRAKVAQRKPRKVRKPAWQRNADRIDGYDRDDIGLSPDY